MRLIGSPREEGRFGPPRDDGGRGRFKIPAMSRARTPAAKGARRAEILRAASALFGEASYPEVTVAQVAERAGLAKGSVYHYFRSKEELFLYLVLDRLSEWLGAVDADLAGLGRRASPEEIGRAFAAGVVGRVDLVRLLALLHGTLEPSVESAQIVEFKRGLLVALTAAGESLEARLPGLRPGEGARFLFRLVAAVTGLALAALPSSAVAAAIAEAPDLAAFRLDFERELTEIAAALVARVAPRSIPPAVRRTAKRQA